MTEKKIKKLNSGDDDDVTQLGDLDLPEVSGVGRPANKRPFLIVKDENGEVSAIADELRKIGDEYVSKADGLEPSKDMTTDELREARVRRSKKFGIEILEGGASHLTYQADRPKDLRLYADPVNLKYSLDTIERANNARTRFKQNFSAYKSEKSRNIVHERIVRAQLGFGVFPGYNDDDELDRALPAELREKMKKGQEMTAKIAAGSKAKLVSMIERAEVRRSALEQRVKQATPSEDDTMPRDLAEEVQGTAAHLRGVSSQYPEFKAGVDAASAPPSGAVSLAEKSQGKIMSALGKAKDLIAASLEAAKAAEEGEEAGNQLPKEIEQGLANAAASLDKAREDVPPAAGEGAKPAGKQDEEEGEEGEAKKSEIAKATETEKAREILWAAMRKVDQGELLSDSEKAALDGIMTELKSGLAGGEKGAAGKQDEEEEGEEATAKQDEEEEAAEKSDDPQKAIAEAVKIIGVCLGKLTPGESADEFVTAELGKAKELLEASVGKAREKAEKAGAKMAASNRKRLMAALQSLNEMAKDLIPEAERAKAVMDFASSAKRSEAKKSVGELESVKAENEELKTKVASLQKQIRTDDRSAPPSNVTPGEASVRKEYETEHEDWSGIPFDANEM